MILNPRQIFDQTGDARQSPERGFIAMRGGTFHKGIGNLLRLLHGQFGFRPCWSFAGQGRAAALLPGILPTVSHLPGNPQTAANLWRRITFLKESGRPSAALFQLGMVSRLGHAQTIASPSLRVTLLCES